MWSQSNFGKALHHKPGTKSFDSVMSGKKAINEVKVMAIYFKGILYRNMILMSLKNDFVVNIEVKEVSQD